MAMLAMNPDPQGRHEVAFLSHNKQDSQCKVPVLGFVFFLLQLNPYSFTFLLLITIWTQRHNIGIL